MNKPRIALFINTPLRDVPGVVLTAFELCQRGATCYLVPQAGGYGDIWALAPDFVLLPYFRPYFAPRAQKYIEAGIQFGLLDTEGAIWSSKEEYAGTLWGDRSLTKKANLICMWGPALAEYAINKEIFDETQVTVTGCPRFDFYCEPYSAIYKKESGTDLVPERKSILINTNFTSGNYADLPLDKFVENFAENFGFTKSEVLRWCGIDAEAITETVRMAGRLARDFPEANVIIRPHPQEKVETYEEQAEKLSNLRVARSGAVSPWILRASAVIQRGCTTAVEANLAGIPAISPRWITVAHDYPIPESVSLQCSDYAYMKTTLQSILAGGFQLPPEIKTAAESLAEDWFYKIDGLSHKRVADAILTSLLPKVRPDRSKCLRFLHGLHNLFPLRIGSISNILRYGLGLSPNWSFRRRSRSEKIEMERSLKLESIRELVNSIAAVKADETPSLVNVSSAHQCEAYITKNYVGRTIVMDCA